MKKQVLIVDDEAAIREMLQTALELADFDCITASNAKDAYKLIIDHRPNIVLLDWMMPNVSGVELARRLKKEEITAELPIIMLTARGEEDSRVQGLDVGADDYVTKPFSTRELIARIRAVLRRSEQRIKQFLEFEGLALDAQAQQVFADNAPVTIGPTEFRLLEFFMKHPDRAYSRSQLLDHVWGGNVYIEDRTIDVHIRRLRKALEKYGYDRFVQTVRGLGYRFSPTVNA
ncbi:MAG: phosphate regulon transcriptional regulator PhoB [Pseudomonadota bacterium]|nr:phosphate regulon transcriptional regulator PhoB [Pseudomonadota bacterium]